MTDTEALDYIKMAVPATDAASRDTIAKRCLKKAVIKYGRMKGTSWNSTAETITLTANDNIYDVGRDLLTDPSGWTILEMWATDRQGWQIHVVSLDDFNEYSRGSTTTGRPIYATVHSDERILEFYPIPDSAYQVWTYFRKVVNNLEDIPEIYHDAVIDYAVLCVKALYDNNIAVQLASSSFKDVSEDSLVMWEGNTIKLVNNATTYPKTGGAFRSDSQNLRGE